MTSRPGLKGILSLLAVSVLFALPLEARSYRSVLREWTRQGRDYTFENLEMRMSWKVTYLSPEFRRARREKLAKEQQWSPAEIERALSEDEAESRRYDIFFAAIYAGSNAWPEIGKDTGRWRMALEGLPSGLPSGSQGGQGVTPVSIERVSISEVERGLYPYLDKWSKAFLLKFPKTVQEGQSFSLQMKGIPATSELQWK